MDSQGISQLSSPIYARLPITAYLHYYASNPGDKAMPQVDDKRPGLEIYFETDFGTVVMKIVHESNLVKVVHLEHLCRSVQQSLTNAQARGIAAPTGNDLPIRAISKSPRLAVWFHGQNGSHHGVQVKFKHDADFDAAMSILRRCGCPESQHRPATATPSAPHSDVQPTPPEIPTDHLVMKGPPYLSTGEPALQLPMPPPALQVPHSSASTFSTPNPPNVWRQALSRTSTAVNTSYDQPGSYVRPSSAQESQQQINHINGNLYGTSSNTYCDSSSLHKTSTMPETVSLHALSSSVSAQQPLRRTLTTVTRGNSASNSQQDHFTRPTSQHQSQQSDVNDAGSYGSTRPPDLNQHQGMTIAPGLPTMHQQQSITSPQGHSVPIEAQQMRCTGSVLPWDSFQAPLTGNVFLQPLEPYAAPVDSGLSVGITPYLPPRRVLPFARPGDDSRDSGFSVKPDAARPSTAQPPMSTSVPEQSNQVERPQTAVPEGLSNAGQLLFSHRQQPRPSPTASTVSSPTCESASRSSDPMRPSSSIGPGSSPLKNAHGVADRSSSPVRPPSALCVQQNVHIAKDVGTAHSHDVLMIPTPDQISKVADPATPSVQPTGGAETESAPPAQGKKRASEAATGNNPPKKRAPAKKKPAKPTATPASTQSADVNTLLHDYFKDFDVDASLQGFMERPRSGRQEFVNELICQHLQNDAFLEFAEHVENAWCRIGLEHPNSEMERERLMVERAMVRR